VDEFLISAVHFLIPDDPAYPEDYRGGTIDIAVFPQWGKLISALDSPEVARYLKAWALDTILDGYVQGRFDELTLRNQKLWIAIQDRDGNVLLNTFAVPENAWVESTFLG
jgi:hypothetical protein